MNKKRLLYIITSLGYGGAERLLLSYIRDLDKNKYEFYVCSLREKPDELQEEVSKYATMINLKIRNRFNPFVIIRLIQLYKKIKPNIIHTHLFQPRFYGTIAFLFYRRAIIITQKHNSVTFKKHNLFLPLEMISMLLNDKVIAISESVKRSLMKYEFIPQNKIRVIPNGFDYEKFYKVGSAKIISKDQEIIIGTVCRLEEQKGIVYLLKAMKIVLMKYPNAQLEIVGDGSLLEKLKRLSYRLGISNSVIFFGKFADVIPFYKRMNIFVLPSIYEGFGIVLLEAMAAGIPIVSTNVDGITEVVVNGESGILVPPKNYEAIANAIINLIENPNLVSKLIDKGFERAKLFDIKKHISQMDEFYEELLGVKS